MTSLCGTVIYNIPKADLNSQMKLHKEAFEDNIKYCSQMYVENSSLITQQWDGFERGENLFPGALGATLAVAQLAVTLCPLHLPSLSCF